jgi:hypothetical protein
MTETRSRGSAGIAALGPNDRIADVEDRLARLEGTPSMRARGRDLMDHVMPPEASRHFRNAGREQLLGIRSIVDFWIRRIDAMESHASGPEAGRETIKVD